MKLLTLLLTCSFLWALKCPYEQIADGVIPNDMQILTAQKLAYSMARQKKLCSSDADEVAQSVSVTVFEKYKLFDPQKGTFIDWCRGIAAHKIQDHFRKQEQQISQLRNEDASPFEVEIEQRLEKMEKQELDSQHPLKKFADFIRVKVDEPTAVEKKTLQEIERVKGFEARLINRFKNNGQSLKAQIVEKAFQGQSLQDIAIELKTPLETIQQQEKEILEDWLKLGQKPFSDYSEFLPKTPVKSLSLCLSRYFYERFKLDKKLADSEDKRDFIKDYLEGSTNPRDRADILLSQKYHISLSKMRGQINTLRKVWIAEAIQKGIIADESQITLTLRKLYSLP